MKYISILCHNCNKEYTPAQKPLCKKCFEKTWGKGKLIDESFEIFIGDDENSFYFIFKNKKIQLEPINDFFGKQNTANKMLALYEINNKCILRFSYFSFENHEKQIETILTLKIYFEETDKAISGVFTIKQKEDKNFIIKYFIEKYGENLIQI